MHAPARLQNQTTPRYFKKSSGVRQSQELSQDRAGAEQIGFEEFDISCIAKRKAVPIVLFTMARDFCCV
jgi:hypothetical protein